MHGGVCGGDAVRGDERVTAVHQIQWHGSIVLDHDGIALPARVAVTMTSSPWNSSTIQTMCDEAAPSTPTEHAVRPHWLPHEEEHGMQTRPAVGAGNDQTGACSKVVT